MANYHIKTGGLITSNAGGPSSDWDVANCYSVDSIQAIIKQLAVSGDSIIFEDETHIISTSPNFSSNTANTTFSITIKSRSGDASNCIIQNGSVDDAIFDHFSSRHAHVVIYEDITFSTLATYTGTGAALFRHVGSGTHTSDTTWTRCVFSNVTTNTTDISDVPMMFSFNQAVTPRIFTFNNCIFSGLSLTAQGKRVGIMYAYLNNHIQINDCIVDDVTLTTNGGSTFPLFYCKTGTMTVDGLTVTNVTTIGNSNSHVEGFLFRQSDDGGDISISNAHVDGLTVEGSEAGCLAPVLYATSSTGSISMDNCSVTNATNLFNGNSEGLLITVGGRGTGSVRDCSVYGNIGFYGSGAFNTFSGEITVTNVKCYNNSGGSAGGYSYENVMGVDFYSSGSGDASYDSCLSHAANTDINNTASTSFYGLLNTVGARTDRDKIITFNNCIFTEPMQKDIPLMFFTNITGETTMTATNIMTVNFINSIIKTDGENIITLRTKAAGSDINLNLVNCNYIASKIDLTNHDSGVVVETA